MPYKTHMEITKLLKEMARIIDTLVKDKMSAKHAQFQLKVLKARIESQDKLTLQEQLAILADEADAIIDGSGAGKYERFQAKRRIRSLLKNAERETTHRFATGIGKWISRKGLFAKFISAAIENFILLLYWLPDLSAMLLPEHASPGMGMRISKVMFNMCLVYLRAGMKTASPLATNLYLCLLTIIYHLVGRRILVIGAYWLAPDRAEILSMPHLSPKEMLPLISITICLFGWKLYSKYKDTLRDKFRRWRDKRKR